jgi:hypothetical protein
MVVRRIREHVSDLNWGAVAVDLAIVIVGVFLGTQVSNWNSARLDREKGQQYRARLVDELITTEAVMTVFKAYATAARAHGVAALDVMDNPSKPAGEDFLVDAYQASQVIPRAGRHTTYDEIVSAGDLSLIGPPYRDRVSNYFWRMDGLLSLDSGSTAYRELLRSAMPIAVQEAIRAKYDEIATDVGAGLVAPHLPLHCQPAIETTLASASATRLRRRPDLEEAMTRQISNLDSRSLTYDKLMANARSLREAIERYDR